MIPEPIVPALAAAALVIAVVGFVLGGWSVLRLRRLGRPESAAPAGGSVAQGQRIDRLGRELADVARRLEAAEAHGQRAMQRVGVVRYNPFHDTGSNQSFVLALLDGKGDGFVLTTLHSRQQTRSFLKAVVGGQAESAISDEEAEAIRLAQAR